MSQLTKSDAELVYRFAGRFKDDAEHEAFSKTLDRWQTDRPSDSHQLEAAHAAPDSQFEWEDIWFETVHEPERVRPHELHALTGYIEEPAVNAIAQAFATDYLNATLDEIRLRQQETTLSGREFATLVLDAAENAPEDRARREMNISVGNYRGKKGAVSDKLARAEATLTVAERVRNTHES